MRPPAPVAHELPVGDPARSLIGRAVLGAPLAACVFIAFTWIAKELPELYDYEPWRDEPYDAMVSFAMWCVPLLLGLCALRVPLCLRHRSLPVRRALDLVRAGRLLLGFVLLTLAGEWTSVALGAHADTWTATTAALIAALAVVTAVAVDAAVAMHRAAREPLWRAAPAQPDWVADAIALVAR